MVSFVCGFFLSLVLDSQEYYNPIKKAQLITLFYFCYLVVAIF